MIFTLYLYETYLDTRTTAAVKRWLRKLFRKGTP